MHPTTGPRYNSWDEFLKLKCTPLLSHMNKDAAFNVIGRYWLDWPAARQPLRSVQMGRSQAAAKQFSLADGAEICLGGICFMGEEGVDFPHPVHLWPLLKLTTNGPCLLQADLSPGIGAPFLLSFWNSDHPVTTFSFYVQRITWWSKVLAFVAVQQLFPCICPTSVPPLVSWKPKVSSDWQRWWDKVHQG